MSELSVGGHLPEIKPVTVAAQVVWRGSTAHIGPVAAATPLQGALLNKTCCGLYLLYIGCVGLITKRMVPIMNTNLNRCLTEQIFAYQFDWRYPSTYGITLTDIDENPDKIAAIRRLVPYFFFDFIERTNGYFLSQAPIADIGFVINLTRHLCGDENKRVVDGWIEGMVERLDKIAYCPNVVGPVLQDFESRSEWEAAVRVIHGQPLPVEVLDMSIKLDPRGFRDSALGQLRTIDPNVNSLLRREEELRALGFVGVPYGFGAAP